MGRSGPDGLLLGSNSEGVLGLEEVIACKVETLFEVADTNNSFPVGEVTDPKGGWPVTLSSDFDTTELSPTDRDKLIDGGFNRSDAQADLQLTFTFTAYRLEAVSRTMVPHEPLLCRGIGSTMLLAARVWEQGPHGQSRWRSGHGRLAF